MGVGEAQSKNTVIYRCAYHVTGCPTSRRPVIEGEVNARFTQVIREVCGERGGTLIEPETMPDRVHLLVECDPADGIPRLIKQITERASPVLRQELPALRSRFPIRWTTSYFVAAVGGTPVEVAKQYVANQRTT